MYLYFIFGKNVNFFQDLKYNVHLCALWEVWGKRATNSKEEAFHSSSFFSSLLSLMQREQNESHLLLVYTSYTGQML